jgi:hypothetical protein
MDEVVKIPHWTLHDLRRTYRTIHAQIGTPPHIAERLINHVSHRSEVEKIYDQYTYLPEMRAACRAYEAHLQSVLLMSERQPMGHRDAPALAEQSDEVSVQEAGTRSDHALVREHRSHGGSRDVSFEVRLGQLRVVSALYVAIVTTAPQRLQNIIALLERMTRREPELRVHFTFKYKPVFHKQWIVRPSCRTCSRTRGSVRDYRRSLCCSSSCRKPAKVVSYG